MSKPALRLLENPFNRDGESDFEIYLTDDKNPNKKLNLSKLYFLKVNCDKVESHVAIGFLAKFIKRHPGLREISIDNLKSVNPAQAPLHTSALQDLAKAIAVVGVINNQCGYPELVIKGINNLPKLTSRDIAKAKQEGHDLMEKKQKKVQESETKLPSLGLKNQGGAPKNQPHVKLGLTFAINHNSYHDNSTKSAKISFSQDNKDYIPQIPPKVTSLTIDCKGYSHLRVLDFLAKFVKANTQLDKIIITGLAKISHEEKEFSKQSTALLKIAKAKNFNDLFRGEDLTLEGLQLPKLCKSDIDQNKIEVAKEGRGEKLPPIKVKSGERFEPMALGGQDPAKLPQIKR